MTDAHFEQLSSLIPFYMLQDAEARTLERDRLGGLGEYLARIATLIHHAMPILQSLQVGARLAYQNGFWARLEAHQLKHGTVDVLVRGLLLNPDMDVSLFKTSPELPVFVREAIVRQEAELTRLTAGGAWWRSCRFQSDFSVPDATQPVEASTNAGGPHVVRPI
jgi:hypothetical protein